MNDKTKDFIRRISRNTGKEDDAYFIALSEELDEYLKTQPQSEVDEFVQSGYGEMLDMCLPPEYLKRIRGLSEQEAEPAQQ